MKFDKIDLVFNLRTSSLPTGLTAKRFFDCSSKTIVQGELKPSADSHMSEAGRGSPSPSQALRGRQLAR